MKTNTIAAWVFGGLLVVVGALNAPFIAERVNAWLGKEAALEEPQTADAPVEAPAVAEAPEDGAQVATATGEQPAIAETPQESAEEDTTEVASLPQGDDT